MPVVTAFLAGASQWRTQLVITAAGLKNRVIGLDYAGVKISIEQLELAITPDIWAGLMTMERAAIAALNGTDGPEN